MVVVVWYGGIEAVGTAGCGGCNAVIDLKMATELLCAKGNPLPIDSSSVSRAKQNCQGYSGASDSRNTDKISRLDRPEGG